MNNDRIQDLIDSAGAMAEMLNIQYRAFISAGFNDYQSMYLCGKLIESFFASKNQEEDE